VARTPRTTDVFPGPARPLADIERQLIDAIAAAPDDDLARQVLADYWMSGADPARGELVSLQLAGGDAADLVDVYWQRWIGALDDEGFDVELARGFTRYPLVLDDSDRLAHAPDTRRVSPRLYVSTHSLDADHRRVCAGVSWTGEPVLLKATMAADDPLGERAIVIEHPNVVQLLDVARWRQFEVLVYAWAGIELRPRAWGEQVAAAVGRQIAAGLAALHAVGTVHCAVSPQHILVDAAGGARLGGFGSARSPLVASQPAYFTVRPQQRRFAYMAPEQVVGRPPVLATDVFALGVVLAEMCTGQHPLGPLGESDFEILEGVRARRHVVPAALVMSTLLDRMLARDPAERPPAAEVATILGELTGRSPARTPTAPPHRW
jgi:uncharacterized protein (TIGR02996 family)